MAVALFFFIQKRGKLDNIEDLYKITDVNIDKDFIVQFRMMDTFKATDEALQNVEYWPKISNVAYFATKLRFTIKHSIFRYRAHVHIAIVTISNSRSHCIAAWEKSNTNFSWILEHFSDEI